jgi:hypothetical protein
MDKLTLNKSLEYLANKFNAKDVFDEYELKETNSVRTIITEDFLKNIDLESKICLNVHYIFHRKGDICFE